MALDRLLSLEPRRGSFGLALAYLEWLGEQPARRLPRQRIGRLEIPLDDFLARIKWSETVGNPTKALGKFRRPI